MSTIKRPEIRAGQLYTREDISAGLDCGEWFVDVLVSLFGLPRLGSKISWYEGGDVIAAMRRHALDDVVGLPPQTARGKDELLKLKRSLQRGEKIEVPEGC